jgi:hypothetical protein
MNSLVQESSVISFSSEHEPHTKVAPIVVGSALFLGKAIVGGVVGSAASWGTTRLLDNRFPSNKSIPF